MRPLTAEWVAKAEADFQLARREMRVCPTPGYDGVCFHALQSAEKYLKAVLQERDVPIPRVHDLARLVDLIDPSIGALHERRPDLAAMTQLSVAVRYPGYFADEDAARQTLEPADHVRCVCRSLLGVPENP